MVDLGGGSDLLQADGGTPETAPAESPEVRQSLQMLKNIKEMGLSIYDVDDPTLSRGRIIFSLAELDLNHVFLLENGVQIVRISGEDVLVGMDPWTGTTVKITGSEVLRGKDLNPTDRRREFVARPNRNSAPLPTSSTGPQKKSLSRATSKRNMSAEQAFQNALGGGARLDEGVMVCKENHGHGRVIFSLMELPLGEVFISLEGSVKMNRLSQDTILINEDVYTILPTGTPITTSDTSPETIAELPPPTAASRSRVVSGRSSRPKSGEYSPVVVPPSPAGSAEFFPREPWQPRVESKRASDGGLNQSATGIVLPGETYSLTAPPPWLSMSMEMDGDIGLGLDSGGAGAGPGGSFGFMGGMGGEPAFATAFANTAPNGVGNGSGDIGDRSWNGTWPGVADTRTGAAAAGSGGSAPAPPSSLNVSMTSINTAATGGTGTHPTTAADGQTSQTVTDDDGDLGGDLGAGL